MSIMEGWEFKKFEIFDMNDPAENAKVSVANDIVKMEFPYVVSLTSQKDFYQTVLRENPIIGKTIAIWEMKGELMDWLEGREYIQPRHCAVLMFKNRNDVMQFVLRWS